MGDFEVLNTIIFIRNRFAAAELEAAFRRLWGKKKKKRQH